MNKKPQYKKHTTGSLGPSFLNANVDTRRAKGKIGILKCHKILWMNY